MHLPNQKLNDAAGRALVGAAGASNSDAQCDEDDDAGMGVITSGYGPGGDEFSPSSSGSLPTHEF